MPQRLALWTFALISTQLLHLHAQEQPPPPSEIEQSPSTPEAAPRSEPSPQDAVSQPPEQEAPEAESEDEGITGIPAPWIAHLVSSATPPCSAHQMPPRPCK